jgi:acetyl esterase
VALDAQAQDLLDAMAAQGMKTFDQMTVPEARDAGLAFIGLQGEPEQVAQVTDRTVPGPAGEIPIRVYTPEGPGPHPVVG